MSNITLHYSIIEVNCILCLEVNILMDCILVMAHAENLACSFIITLI